MQRKIKAADVIERVHTEVDTGEKDFFSLYFFINTHKVHVRAVLRSLWALEWVANSSN